MESGKSTARLLAFNNATQFLKAEARLPALVLRSGWARVFFFESDEIMSSSFAKFVKELCRIEGGVLSCLVNLTLTNEFNFKEAAMVFIDPSDKEGEYIEKMKEGGPASGWLYGMDRYGCASDKGEWCIYSEKENDIAFIAFHNSVVINKYVEVMKIVNAISGSSLLSEDMGSSSLISLSKNWRSTLVQNYGILAI